MIISVICFIILQQQSIESCIFLHKWDEFSFSLLIIHVTGSGSSWRRERKREREEEFMRKVRPA
jgi:hypothetical protein